MTIETALAVSILTLCVMAVLVVGALVFVHVRRATSAPALEVARLMLPDVQRALRAVAVRVLGSREPEVPDDE